MSRNHTILNHCLINLRAIFVQPRDSVLVLRLVECCRIGGVPIGSHNCFIPSCERIGVLLIRRFGGRLTGINRKFTLLYFYRSQQCAIFIHEADGKIMGVAIIEITFICI